MPEPPVSKVRFKKRDIAALEDMPSSMADDRIVLRSHPLRSKGRRVLGGMLLVAAFLAVALGALFAALEIGLADGQIRDRAHAALAKAVGPENRSELASAALRLTWRGQLALEARDVVVKPVSGNAKPHHADRVLISLDPLALLAGRIALDSAEISGLGLTAPQGAGFDLGDLADLRVDATDDVIEGLFVSLNRMARRVESAEISVFRVSDVAISGSGSPWLVQKAVFERLENGDFRITADMSRDDQDITFEGRATSEGRAAGLSKISGSIAGLAIDLSNNAIIDRRNGLKTSVGVKFEAARADDDDGPGLRATISAAGGALMMGGVEAQIADVRVNLVYMPSEDKIEITRSLIRLGETVMPFTGGLIDADRVDRIEGEGVAFDFIINNGLAAPGDSNEAPIAFDGKAFGWFDPAQRLLIAEELTVASASGGMFGSASWRFVTGVSPELNLIAQSPSMSTSTVKQLWPYWIGKGARQWVLNNLYGGRVTNGRIQISVPAGHFPLNSPATFNEDQLQIDFDIERARMNVAGDIPPLRDTLGHMRLRGSRVDVSVSSATGFFPTGRRVEVSDASFSIPAVNERPLMAELAMSVSGDADAVAELITYHPIKALDRIGLEPEDLDGRISSQVTARFGLIATQSPPPPDWTVELEMAGVDIAKPVEGRSLKRMDGTLSVTPVRAELKTDADIDGTRMTLDVVQPVGNSGVEGKRKLSGMLDPEVREAIAPGSGALISGPVGFTMETSAKAESMVTLDLKPATLTVPGIGWTKGAGVAAELKFAMTTENGTTRLSELELSGDGFSANGVVTLTDGALSSAEFTKVALSPRENYRASIAKTARGYKIEVGGVAFDARPIIDLAKSNASSKASDGSSPLIEVSGNVDAVLGYSDEKFSSGSIRYRGQGEQISLLDFKAVSQSGQAVVIAINGEGENDTVQMTSGDAGAFARFSGIYSRIQGGLLNIRLSRQGGPLRRGAIDIRNFTVVGEPRLDSLVSTRSKQDGRSLRETVRTEIDVSEARFEIANAKLVTGNGAVVVSEGVVRGPQIGASFQGTVRDAEGRIDMTGTFMPAYGVNRLFSELPLIGVLLGNGRDRGLIGITFRMTGKTDSPLLQVNPLSVIAPGVFRSIFEYRP
ncbi:hypothetical protein HPDFL43_09342 [Hoeflea phototrophica DFL-43]|uniref:Uncharacterized protein n=2 Tax=Hoeflea TaxID=274591 RepID=A9D660_HOEPD|nr:hypothetical protein HPDFL43_09342 [Hoeflea phototrophica DFL-43]